MKRSQAPDTNPAALDCNGSLLRTGYKPFENQNLSLHLTLYSVFLQKFIHALSLKTDLQLSPKLRTTIQDGRAYRAFLKQTGVEPPVCFSQENILTVHLKRRLKKKKRTFLSYISKCLCRRYRSEGHSGRGGMRRAHPQPLFGTDVAGLG